MYIIYGNKFIDYFANGIIRIKFLMQNYHISLHRNHEIITIQLWSYLLHALHLVSLKLNCNVPKGIFTFHRKALSLSLVIWYAFFCWDVSTCSSSFYTWRGIFQPQRRQLDNLLRKHCILRCDCSALSTCRFLCNNSVQEGAW